MDYRDLGMRIRLSRREHSLTQDQLAERIGISPSFLGHIERGTRVASLETFVEICNALNVSPEYLLQGSLESYNMQMPEGLTNEQRAKLREFIRLAEETIASMDDESM